VSEELLRSVNHIPPRMLVKAGSTLLVPRTDRRQEDVPEHLADNATLAFAPDTPPARKVSVKAGKRGESVASVARRYRLNVNQVAQWNDISAAGKFKPGQAITLFLPAGKASAKSGSSSRARAAKPAAATRKVASQPTRARPARK
jgi:membrane-bound lytic murein transglycosylase D